MRALQAVVVARQDQVFFHQFERLALPGVEGGGQVGDVGLLEIEGGKLLFGLVEDLTVGDGLVPGDVVDRIDLLQVHGDPLQTVGDLHGDRLEVHRTGLLEIGELGDLHAVEPDLPAQAPGTQGGRFPVILDEADVVFEQVEAEPFQALQVHGLHILGRRLDHHLVLVVVLQPVGVLAVASVRGPAAGLDVGRLPRFRAEGAEQGGGVEGAGAHLHVVGLEHNAAGGGPVAVQSGNNILKIHAVLFPSGWLVG